ncbi:MAG TPA: hypothetical protein VGO96_15205 [Pyrinomonadaceae bacterium]|jgi:hypothetical protein|nr:hypothetical protein [Pyrinomonadaceae bacterium]
MKPYKGLIAGIIGTTILTFTALLPFVVHILPANGLARWLIIFALSIISLIIAMIVNYGAFSSVRQATLSERNAEQLYLSVQDRLIPLLLEGLEDTLHRRINSLPAYLSNQVGYEKNLKFYVFAQVEGYHRIIASTDDAAASVRKIALELDEGLVGYAYNHKVSIFADSLIECSTIYDRYFKSIGQPQAIDHSTLEKCDIAVQCVYTMPIYENKRSAPWSNNVIGVLTVDSTQRNDDKLFLSNAFQKEVEEIAADITPYLAVFEELKHKS